MRMEAAGLWLAATRLPNGGSVQITSAVSNTKLCFERPSKTKGKEIDLPCTPDDENLLFLPLVSIKILPPADASELPGRPPPPCLS